MTLFRTITETWVGRWANLVYLFGIPASAAVGGSLISFFVGSALIWNIAGLASGRIQVPRDRHLLIYTSVLFAFFAVRFVSVFLGDDPSFNPLSALKPISFLAFLPMAAALLHAPVRRQLDVFACGAATGAVLGALLALFQVYALDMPRAEGGAGNAGPFALIMAVSGGISLILAASRDKADQLLGIAGWLCGIVGALLSGSKGILPALAVNAVIGAAYLWHLKSPLISLKTGAAAALCLVVAGLVASPVINWRIVQFKDDISNLEKGRLVRSAGARYVMWQEGLAIVPEALIFGHGYNLRSKAAEPEIIKRTGSGPGSHLHNSFITDLVGNGIAGLLSHLAVLVAPFWLLRPFKHEADYLKARAMTVIVVASYVTADLTNLTFGHDIMDSWFVFFVCATMSALPKTAGRSP
jgi:O-antigen ligase